MISEAGLTLEVNAGGRIQGIDCNNKAIARVTGPIQAIATFPRDV